MKTYTVSQLAKLAGVSVRTLHHYDTIGLLKPSSRTEAGYRLYGKPDLYRLQQILFFKELDLPLLEILKILDDPEFDQIEALQNHKRLLQNRSHRINNLLSTIDKTLRKLVEDDMKVTDEELYEGFTKAQRARYEREVNEKYDPTIVKEANRRVRNMSKSEWKAYKEEGDFVTRSLAELMHEPPGNEMVQTLIARHFATIEVFYPVSAERYRGLAQMYVEHDEFRAFYDKYAPGLADFMHKAMNYYADYSL